MTSFAHLIAARGIPPLYTQEQVCEADKMLYLRLTLPAFPWQWFVAEQQMDGSRHFSFFGFVAGDENEWGYFSTRELRSTSRPLIIDRNFKPMPFAEAKKKYKF
jgi:hypothetical protein